MNTCGEENSLGTVIPVILELLITNSSDIFTHSCSRAYAHHPRCHNPSLGNHIIWVVFNVVRCCALRSIWLHRNKRLYYSDIMTCSPFVLNQARSYVLIHLRKIQDNELNNGRGKRVNFLRKMVAFFSSPITTIHTTTATISPSISSDSLASSCPSRLFFFLHRF
ncbi:hypothetical protein PsorP6_015360 [Peronosclerospora sorghi]|uniref:Uncharacterized protein n=1 Tax=Peronosclerospora sorghi TaxID=230839 RepID=A0ACC0WNH6_9STRA|nr:hypothetical protein PsorP6_015360 [Peronosclerospora sorghi]